MSQDNNLAFIREKVTSLRSAIMYSLCSEVIRFPNSLVTALTIDEEGQLWLVCDKPSYLLDQCPDSFPVRLHFYRKGIPYHIEMGGNVLIMNDQYAGEAEFNKPLLLKMDIENIEYTEITPSRKTRLELWWQQALNWAAEHIAIPRSSKPTLQQLQGMNLNRS